jgi:hypothetical protein
MKLINYFCFFKQALKLNSVREEELQFVQCLYQHCQVLPSVLKELSQNLWSRLLTLLTDPHTYTSDFTTHTGGGVAQTNSHTAHMDRQAGSSSESPLVKFENNSRGAKRSWQEFDAVAQKRRKVHRASAVQDLLETPVGADTKSTGQVVMATILGGDPQSPETMTGARAQERRIGAGSVLEDAGVDVSSDDLLDSLLDTAVVILSASPVPVFTEFLKQLQQVLVRFFF